MICYQLIVLSFALSAAVDHANKTASLGSPCCPEVPTELMKLGECANGENITLNCYGEHFYQLNPHYDNFKIEGDVLTITANDMRDEIPPDMFCSGFQNVDGKKEQVVFVCFKEIVEDSNIMLNKLYGYCLLTSDIFLAITFITYCLLPSLRDLQGKCVMCFTASLFVAYFSVSLMQLDFFGLSVPDNLCIFSGFFTYYWLLCVYFWLYNISFNIWRGTSAAHTCPEKTLWIGYLMLGFGGPLLLVTVALITHHIPGDHIKPHFDYGICWFPGKTESWTFFYGPMALLLTCNIIYFILTAVRLWKDYRQSTPQPRIRTLRFKWCLYVKIFFTMGIPWIFEILSYLQGNNWWITDILNCLQGLIIFIMMVATRKKVIRAIASSRLFSSYISNTWQEMDDEESYDETNTEQIQLS